MGRSFNSPDCAGRQRPEGCASAYQAVVVDMSREISEVYQALQQGREVVVATVISSSGSTPRTSGTKMMIYKDGLISGTIGGGEVEGDIIRLAQNRFSTTGGAIVAYDLNRKGVKDRMDLICGGKMEVLLEHVSADDTIRKLYVTAHDKISQGQSFIWAATVQGKGEDLTIEREILDGSDVDSQAVDRATIFRDKGKLRLLEPVVPGQSLYIFGAGHVSLELASLSENLGMIIHVFDDREEFANSLRFPNVDGVHVCPAYSDVFKPFAIGADSYIVIVTRGHSFDKKVLAQALKTDAGYIGMIGSRKKRNTIYAELTREGFDQAILDSVHCPVGLPIQAETPKEIAVSIVAELIQHRARQHSTG